MARKNSLRKYSVLRKRRTVMALDLDVHAFAVAHAARNHLTMRRAARELVLAGAAYLSAWEPTAKATDPLKVLRPTETTD